MTFNVYNDLKFVLDNDFEGHLKIKHNFKKKLPLVFMAKMIKN